MTIAAYPLTWPEGWKRTSSGYRKHSAYKVDFIKARDDIAREFKLLGAVSGTVVISTNIPTRRDGLPLASYRQPDDPGVAVFWTVRRGGKLVDRVIACDVWQKVHENIRAVGLSVEALRMLERAGASEILDRAFTGFNALPPPSSAPITPHWMTILEIRELDSERPLTREAIEQRFRALARVRHPDAGGTAEAFRELVAAKESALKELGG